LENSSCNCLPRACRTMPHLTAHEPRQHAIFGRNVVAGESPALSSPPIEILPCSISSPMYLNPTGVSCNRPCDIEPRR
jgi:hypothetical protein